MNKSQVSRPEHPALSQVWNELPTDYQTNAVRLMIQLALKLVTAQWNWRQQEAENVKLNGHIQSPGRPS